MSVPAPAAVRGDADAAGYDRAEQLRWFGVLWAMALAFHVAAFQPLAAVPVLLGAAPALLRRPSALACAAPLVTGAVVALVSLPSAANHLVLALLVAAGFGAAALYAIPRRGGEPFAVRWLDAARTPAGLTLLVVYCATVLDKLNTGFLDPVSSCAGVLPAAAAERLGLGPLTPGPAVVTGAAVATILTEAGVLVLLAVPRWRCRGVALGAAFHTVLALTGFGHFTTFVLALYVLLLPPRTLAGLADRWSARRRLVLAGTGLHVVFSLGAGLPGQDTGPLGLVWTALLTATWLVAAGPIVVPLIRACLADPGPGPPWRWRPIALLVVPLLAAGNGALPYLGLKTVSTYSMYSNLRTEEGHPNHVVPGITALALGGYQRDTVTVTALVWPDRIPLGARHLVLDPRRHLETAASWTTEPRPLRLPWTELRRTVMTWRDAGVHDVVLGYERAGRTRVVPDAIADPALSAPLPWAEEHLLAFRAVDQAGTTSTCRW